MRQLEWNEAEGRLKHNEIVGAVQQDHTLLSWRERTWWSKEREWVNVKLVTDDLQRMEEKRRVSVTLGEPQQGTWTAKNEVMSMHDNWSHLWSIKSQYAPDTWNGLIRKMVRCKDLKNGCDDCGCHIMGLGVVALLAGLASSSSLIKVLLQE